MKKRRAVFLDRDGVLNKVVYAGGVSCPPVDAESMELIPGAKEAVLRLHAADFLCICVTNQPDIARGTRTRENVDAINDRVDIALKLDDIYVCPHDNSDNCSCRKPKPGMLLMAAEKWSIDLAESWMVGDRRTDIEAGEAAGCRTVLIASGDLLPGETIFACSDILSAVDLILSQPCP